MSLRVRTWLALALATGACSKKSDDHAAPPSPGPVSPATPAAPPADDRYDAASLGATTFALTEGNPAARAHFTRGLLALHSFWYDEAMREFRAAVAADPSMNMAHWGVAMAACKILFGDDDIGVASAALRAMPAPEKLSERETAWVLALLDLLDAGDVRQSRKKFLAAMETLYAQYPDDEAATFLALALLSSTRPEDPDTLQVRTRAAELAAGVYQHNPKHPGAAHYLIHAFDTPELAARGLPYARAYASIAPAAFHARHMPAHIFSRLGMWPEAIASCQSAWDASVAAAQHDKLSANHHDFHSLSWLVEMSFELGHRAEADRAMTRYADAVRAGLDHQQRLGYATEVASYLARTGEWKRIDELLAPLDAPAVEDPSPDASSLRSGPPGSHCAPPSATSPLALGEQQAVLLARARAAAMQRDLPATKRYLADADAVRQRLRPSLEAMQAKDTLARLDAIEVKRKAAMLARAAGDDRALVAVLRQLAAAADEETGGETNPSAFVTHEEIGDALLRLKQPGQALAAYKLALAKHPGRAHALLGAARAATAAGQREVAATFYATLKAQWATADAGTEGVDETRSPPVRASSAPAP